MLHVPEHVFDVVMVVLRSSFRWCLWSKSSVFPFHWLAVIMLVIHCAPNYLNTAFFDSFPNYYLFTVTVRVAR